MIVINNTPKHAKVQAPFGLGVRVMVFNNIYS